MTIFWQIVGGTVASLGGVAATVILVVKFCGGIIAERLQKKYELKLNEDLESHICCFRQKNYISKARFEKEFAVYQ